MAIWETIKDNWFEILTAIGTIAAIFTTRAKPSMSEKKERKAAKLESKAQKKLDQAKKDYEKAASLKKGD